MELDTVYVSSANIVLETTFGEEAPQRKQMVDVAHWMEDSIGTNGCQDTEDGTSLSVSLQVSLESVRGQPCECHSLWLDQACQKAPRLTLNWCWETSKLP